MTNDDGAHGRPEQPVTRVGRSTGTDAACDCALHPVTVRVARWRPWRASARIAIKGLHCDACAARVENELLDVTGVAAARVRRTAGLALVLYDPLRVTPEDLLRAVERAAGGMQPRYDGVVLY